MIKEQIERIAKNCGVKISYMEEGKGGFIVDSSGIVYDSCNDIFMELFNEHNESEGN